MSAESHQGEQGRIQTFKLLLITIPNNQRSRRIRLQPRLRYFFSLTVCACAFALGIAEARSVDSLPLRSVRGPEVTLHYVTLGHGEPVVMVHGGLEDYRAWSAQLAPLAEIVPPK